jgi:hypothetical protein
MVSGGRQDRLDRDLAIDGGDHLFDRVVDQLQRLVALLRR